MHIYPNVVRCIPASGGRRNIDAGARRTPVVMRRVALFAAVATVLVPTGLHHEARADTACAHGPAPYAGIPGASMTATDYVSKDEPPLPYVRWRGTVPAFDGLPF